MKMGKFLLEGARFTGELYIETELNAEEELSEVVPMDVYPTSDGLITLYLYPSKAFVPEIFPTSTLDKNKFGVKLSLGKGILIRLKDGAEYKLILYADLPTLEPVDLIADVMRDAENLEND